MQELDQKQLSWVNDLIDAADSWGRPVLERLRDAYLDATAPSRAPDWGVTREDVRYALTTTLRADWSVDSIGCTGAYVTANSIDTAADAILARLAASHAGDRERLYGAMVLIHDVARNTTNDRQGMRAVLRYSEAALAPAAGQDDAGECG